MQILVTCAFGKNLFIVSETSQAVSSEPAFQCWVPCIHIEKERLGDQSYEEMLLWTLEKFGLESPKSVRRALEIDHKTGKPFGKMPSGKKLGQYFRLWRC